MVVIRQEEDLLELEGLNNYWRMLAGNLLLLTAVAATYFILNIYFGLFKELDTPDGIIAIILAIISYLALRNIRAARHPWYAVRKLRISANGIEYNRFKDPGRSTLILSPMINQLILAESGDVMQFYLNGAKRPRFTIDLEQTIFSGKGDAFVETIGRLLVLKPAGLITEHFWKKYQLRKYTPSSGQPEDLTLGQSIRASNHLSVRRNDEGWIIIEANRNVSSGTSLGIDMETDTLSARNGLLGDVHFRKGELADYTIGFKTMTPQMSSTVMIGTLRGVRLNGGTSRLLIITVKYRGNGMDQQFAIQQDLEIVADYLRENSK